MSRDQMGLFGGAETEYPDGFRYQLDVVSVELEQTLLDRMPSLPLKEFEFHGYVGKRRIVSFGWRYDYTARVLRKSNDIPDFILPVRAIAAQFAEVAPEKLQQVLITEYSPGAGIGWHRDKAEFGQVIGISLLSPCVFRLRRKIGAKWERVSLTAAPRSAYLLSGAARSEWEHSIPDVDALRYSITFRNLREDAPPPLDSDAG